MKAKLLSLAVVGTLIFASAPSANFLGDSAIEAPSAKSSLGINSKELIGIRNTTTTTTKKTDTTTKTTTTTGIE